MKYSKRSDTVIRITGAWLLSSQGDKTDGNFMLTSDHFLHAVDDLFCHIALCFFPQL